MNEVVDGSVGTGTGQLDGLLEEQGHIFIVVLIYLFWSRLSSNTPSLESW